MPHSKKVLTAVEEFTSAVASGDQELAYDSLSTALYEGACQHKAKSGKASARATAAATAADADVVSAIDSATSTVQTVARSAQPAAATTAPAVGSPLTDSLWALFLTQVAPAILDWLKKRFGG